MPKPPTRPYRLKGVVETFGDPLPFLNEKEAWEKQIVALHLPTPLIYAYDRTRLVTRIRAHRLIAQHLVDTLMKCLDVGIPTSRLKYGGCYVWRAKRSGTSLSLHTWGIAVDIEPGENPMDRPWTNDGVMLDPRVLAVFESQGWFWGNDFARPNPMHFQWASGA